MLELTQARNQASDESDFNLMISDGSGSACSAWRTKAIRTKLNVNRRHDGTFMKTALNSREKLAVKHVFDLWKRLINFFPLRGSEWRTNGYAFKSFLFAVCPANLCSRRREIVETHDPLQTSAFIAFSNIYNFQKTFNMVLCLSRN